MRSSFTTRRRSTSMLAKPKAVLWDFDGTLVDTEPIWAEIEAEMLAEHGVIWDEEMMRSVIGQNAFVTTRQMAESIGMPERQEEIHAELHERIVARLLRDGLPFLPGTRELLAAAEADGVPAAVVTASNGFIMQATRHLLPDVVRFVISADDVAVPKPDPEAYLLALSRLGVDPAEAIILEDSVPGTRSALDSGPSSTLYPRSPNSSRIRAWSSRTTPCGARPGPISCRSGANFPRWPVDGPLRSRHRCPARR
ncbi:HAD family phosphatase [Tessaracoccus sp. HDW20]|nr:HAD family phosphatase [Tessaracoccus coleopterorum]NHB86062.1 HAD family phosphatase [Tessaracoccus coleopterorum]